MYLLLAFAVFVSTVAIDFAHARYTQAVAEFRAHRAGLWSLASFGAAALAFVLVVDVSLWLMIPEGLGYYVGTRLALR